MRSALFNALTLASGFAIPIIGLVVYYFLHGGLRNLYQQAVIGIFDLPNAYGIPLPALAPWSLHPDTWGMRAFAYFPPGIVQLMLEGRMPLGSDWMLAGLEFWVKLVYLIPVAACLAQALVLLRRIAVARDDVVTNRQFVLVVVSSLVYASMLYRADWAHLMAVAPPLVAIVTVAVVEFSSVLPWVGRALGVGLMAFWVIGAGISAWATVAANRTPVDTPRGRLLTTATEAQAAQQVLDWTAQQSTDEALAFLPAQPLYYFLSGRPLRLPSRGLLLPGELGAQGDSEFAEALHNTDHVVYNLTRVPFVEGDVVTYAPATASVLSSAFQIERALSPTAIVLRRRAPEPDHAIKITGLWDELQESAERLPGSQGPMKIGRSRPGEWMFYHVVSMAPGTVSSPSCVNTRHDVEAGDILITTPMFPPATWFRDYPAAEPLGPFVRFTIDLVVDAEPAIPLDDRTFSAEIPRSSIRKELDRWAGQSVTLRFCTSSSAPLSTADRPLVGWAEPRIVHASPSGSAPSPPTPSHVQ